MKNRTGFAICVFLLLFSSVTAAKTAQRDFFLVSIPKSGTHLAVKLLVLLTDKKPNALNASINIENNRYKIFEDLVLNLKITNQFAYNHTEKGYLGEHFALFGKQHPEYVQIVQIRDLRDVIVSYIYHPGSLQHFIEEMGGDFSIEEKLTHILSKNESPWALHLEKNITDAIDMISDSNVFVLRFEELIGPEGGGSLETQVQAITRLASELQVPLTESKLNFIRNNLFGNNNGPTSICHIPQRPNWLLEGAFHKRARTAF